MQISANHSVRQSSSHVSKVLDSIAEGMYRDLVKSFALTELLVPRDFAEKHGAIRGLPVTMTTRRFAGGPLESLTHARVFTGDDQTMSCTISAFPKAGYGLPILGIDFVAFGGKLHLAVMDLSVTCRATWERTAEAPLRRIKSAVLADLVERKRPDFVAESFSPEAMFLAARPGSEAKAATAALQLIDVYKSILHTAEPMNDAGAANVAYERSVFWRQQMRHNKKENIALTSVFGPDVTTYLEQFLFAIPN